jgi:hypothetical protein
MKGNKKLSEKSVTGQPSNHKSDHSNINHSFTAGGLLLIIFAQATIGRHFSNLDIHGAASAIEYP